MVLIATIDTIVNDSNTLALVDRLINREDININDVRKPM